MLEPDQGCIKPNVNVEQANELIKKLYGLCPEGGVGSIKEFVSYDDRNFFFKPDKRYNIYLLFHSHYLFLLNIKVSRY